MFNTLILNKAYDDDDDYIITKRYVNINSLFY